MGILAGPYGGFAIGNLRGFPREAEEISFCIKPGDGDGDGGDGSYNLDFRFEDTDSETSVDFIDLSAPAGGGWRCHTLEIGGKVRAFINERKWDKITFQDVGRRSTFYLYGIDVKVPPGVELDSPQEEEEEDEDKVEVEKEAAEEAGGGDGENTEDGEVE